jgi:hypothetical protein
MQTGYHFGTPFPPGVAGRVPHPPTGERSMSRKLFLALGALVAVLLVPVFAEDKKAPADEKKADEKKAIEGTMVCGKCKLKETDKCSNVVQVKEGDKTVNYYLKDDGPKAPYHKDCCQADVKVKVTGGKVVEKDGKKTIEDGKVEVV